MKKLDPTQNQHTSIHLDLHQGHHLPPSPSHISSIIIIATQSLTLSTFAARIIIANKPAAAA
jgi:hypothetical protein